MGPIWAFSNTHQTLALGVCLANQQVFEGWDMYTETTWGNNKKVDRSSAIIHLYILLPLTLHRTRLSIPSCVFKPHQ